MLASHGVVAVRNAANLATVASKVNGVVGVGSAAHMNDFVERFKNAIAEHRHWARSMKDQVPA